MTTNTKRAVVSGRIIKHNGHVLVVMRSAHVTAHATSDGNMRDTIDALHDCADKLVEHSGDRTGRPTYTNDGQLV